MVKTVLVSIAIPSVTIAMLFLAIGASAQQAAENPAREADEASPESNKIHGVDAIADYYLPVYSQGASSVEGSADRTSEARESVELWKEVERFEADRGGDPRGIGQLDLEQAFEELRLEMSMSTDEFDEFLADVESEAAPGIRLPESVNEIPPVAFRPLYTELATVCSVPSALSIYPFGDGDLPPVLQQYERSQPLDIGANSQASSAWSLDSRNDVVTYAIRYVSSPEVLVVVSVASADCLVADILDQISIERGAGR